MTDQKKTHQPQPPIAVSPDEAARLAGIGRTTLYAALAKGDLPSIKIGTRRLILVDAIRDWLAQHQG
ncbi:excisionase family DNA binding domain-containing protein [Actibacterium atlanticum]|uniref:Excisionase family DNA binding domain-containing protein n=1 Tax=Actibacterium atlanticum TaxID=1461693 RepID=A0A058ZJS5_9RHOB|nr:helix-turn-helix domain-containing protein [Actibacterium atlanticum]KCV81859.1 excisionase family DNA binding domain-containing protein [Actibacterium atlanticum]